MLKQNFFDISKIKRNPEFFRNTLSELNHFNPLFARISPDTLNTCTQFDFDRLNKSYFKYVSTIIYHTFQSRIVNPIINCLEFAAYEWDDLNLVNDLLLQKGIFHNCDIFKSKKSSMRVQPNWLTFKIYGMLLPDKDYRALDKTSAWKYTKQKILSIQTEDARRKIYDVFDYTNYDCLADALIPIFCEWEEMNVKPSQSLYFDNPLKDITLGQLKKDSFSRICRLIDFSNNTSKHETFTSNILVDLPPLDGLPEHLSKNVIDTWKNKLKNHDNKRCVPIIEKATEWHKWTDNDKAALIGVTRETYNRIKNSVK